MAWPWDRIPPWAVTLVGPALSEVTERLKQPELLNGVREKVGHALAEIPEAAARRVDQVVKTAKKAAESVQRWAADRTAPAVTVINASGVVFPVESATQPVCAEVALAWTAAASTWSASETDRHGSRAERALRAQVRSLSGCSVRVAATWPSSVIAAAMAVPGTVLVPRIYARQIGSVGPLPDVLRAAHLSVSELGSVSDTSGSWDRGTTFQGQSIFLWSDDPQILQHLRSPSLQSLLKIVIGRQAWPIEPSMTPLASSSATEQMTWKGLLEAGADLVVVPGNELLGGPSCGLILGDESKLAALDQQPLWQALQADAPTHAACVTAIDLWSQGIASQRSHILASIQSSIENVRHRANLLATRLGAIENITCEVKEGTTKVWPIGSLELPSAWLCLTQSGISGEAWSKKLAQYVPVVWVRYNEASILLDVRTIEPSSEGALIAALGGDVHRTAAETHPDDAEPNPTSVGH